MMGFHHSLCLTLVAITFAVEAETCITLLGGAGKVGGSCALVERNDARLLVDCGSSFDAEGGARGADGSFGFDPTTIGAVVLTHAHQDHAGRIPELFHAGFTGVVYATEPTIEILRTMYKSQVRYDAVTRRSWRWSKKSKHGGTVHWRDDCKWNMQISKANLRTFSGTFRELSEHLLRQEDVRAGRIACCRTCAELELNGIMSRMLPIGHGERKRVGAFTITLNPVLHLPGAASVRIEDGEKSFLFSGDMGTFRSRLGGRPTPAPKADWVFVESTYGAGRGEDAEQTEREYARFRAAIGETVRRGGLAWIPAFALDRSQRVLLEVARGMREGVIPADAPIWMTSPTAREITSSYVDHPNWFAEGTLNGLKELLHRARGRFNPARDRRKSGILLTTSGMMDSAVSRTLIPHLLPQAKVTVCLVGYQAPDTPGYALLNGARELIMKDGEKQQKVSVAARVERKFDCFSGHGDAMEIDAWLANNRDSRIFLVHGDPQNLTARRDDLAARLKARVEVAEPGMRYHAR